MTFHILSLALAGILSLADYITEHIFPQRIRANQKLISFSAGTAVSYIILNLFPEISLYSLIGGKKVFLYALLGFVALNLIEQYVSKEIKKPENPSAYHKGVHVAYFFAYNFLIGLILINFTSKGLAQTLLFFVPFLLYIIAEILPQEFRFKNKASAIAYSMAPLFGAFIGINFLGFTTSIFGELIAFLTGTSLYIVIRESLPSDKAEKPVYFLTGVLSYTLVIFMSWNLV